MIHSVNYSSNAYLWECGKKLNVHAKEFIPEARPKALDIKEESNFKPLDRGEYHESKDYLTYPFPKGDDIAQHLFIDTAVLPIINDPLRSFDGIEDKDLGFRVSHADS